MPRGLGGKGDCPPPHLKYKLTKVFLMQSGAQIVVKHVHIVYLKCIYSFPCFPYACVPPSGTWTQHECRMRSRDRVCCLLQCKKTTESPTGPCCATHSPFHAFMNTSDLPSTDNLAPAVHPYTMPVSRIYSTSLLILLQHSVLQYFLLYIEQKLYGPLWVP